MSDLFDMTGKIALITGSTKGIGRAIAERMAEHGAKVVISSRNPDLCDEVAASINNARKSDAAVAIPCNISHKEALQELVAKTREKWGKIDTLICNAAVNPYFGPSADCPDDAFDKVMNVNIKSNMWLINMVMPEMVERKNGSVTIISSIGGLKGSDTLGVYAISKAADFQIARNLAVEYGAHNIRANCIAPGLIKTNFARALWDNPAILKSSNQGTPLARIGMPDEIAGAAVFLSSKAGAYMTGQMMVIDGGRTIT